jgi:hypothetical protein
MNYWATGELVGVRDGLQPLDNIGEPCRIRTCDPLIKSPFDCDRQGFENTSKTAPIAVLEALSVVYVLSTIGLFCHVFFTILSRWFMRRTIKV